MDAAETGAGVCEKAEDAANTKAAQALK